MVAIESFCDRLLDPYALEFYPLPYIPYLVPLLIYFWPQEARRDKFNTFQMVLYLSNAKRRLCGFSCSNSIKSIPYTGGNIDTDK